MKNKKILFAAYSLDIGGIETALVTLINYLSKMNYDITLVLEKKQGIFLDKINPNINIIEYTPSYSKIKLISKLKNGFKRLKFNLKYKNKFDCGICFATYCLSASFVARACSKNSVLWVHNDYLTYYKNDVEKFKNFFYKINADKFKTIVFVSKKAKLNYEKIFIENYKIDNTNFEEKITKNDERKNEKEKINNENFKKRKNNIENSNTNQNLIFCNNLINYKEIIKKSDEKINDLKKENNETIFLNIGRHDETQKRLSRLIESAKKLKQKNYKFKIYFVGDGQDSKNYKELVKKYNLENEIIFLGKKKNPYPYFKKSDCVILTSDYEGYPVVFVEAMILNKPIITTDVSDAKNDIDGKFGVVCEKNVESITNAMEKFINNGFEIKNKFNPEKYNNEIIQKIEKII